MAIPDQPSASIDSSAFLAPRGSLWHRVRCYIKIHLAKTLIATFLVIRSLPGIRNISLLPTLTKVYPNQKTLKNRIFYPKSYQTGDLLPLYISIHGGGFALGNPSQDDKFCSNFATDNNILVVSLDYPKSPGSPFPGAVFALIALTKNVLSDPTLPFDRRKVAIGGFSAGGNLALAVCQDAQLQGRIGGVVAFYPVIDYTTTTAAKLATRPAHAPTDPLANHMSMFKWGYIEPGTDLRDPQLSVMFAPKEKLPPKIFFIGCEFDLLCRESEVLAERLASEISGEVINSGNLWEKSGIKWEKVIGEEHGFDAMPGLGAKFTRAHKRGAEVYKSVAEFLFREVY